MFQFLFRELPLLKSHREEIKVSGWNWVFVVNRLQVGYTLLLLPTQLISGDNYWILLLGFVISQVNLFFISRWITYKKSDKEKKGGALSKLFINLTLAAGVGFLLIKLLVIIIGYAKVIQLYLLRYDRIISIIIVLGILVVYLTYQGIQNITRFSVYSFIFSAWIILFYIQVLFAPASTFNDFIPIWNGFSVEKDISKLFYILSAFSGPELILLLPKGVLPTKKVFTYFTIGNTLTLLEFSFFFYLSVIFFGQNYLEKVEYPLVSMARYMQLPITDRLEMFIISFFMFPLIFSLSFVNFFIFKGFLYTFKTKLNNITYIIYSFCLIWIILFVENKYWAESDQSKIWLNYYVYLTALVYTVIPLVLFIIKKVKKE